MIKLAQSGILALALLLGVHPAATNAEPRSSVPTPGIQVHRETTARGIGLFARDVKNLRDRITRVLQPPIQTGKFPFPNWHFRRPSRGGEPGSMPSIVVRKDIDYKILRMHVSKDVDYKIIDLFGDRRFHPRFFRLP